VQWVIKRDRRKRFRFASLQSEGARRALAEAGAPEALPDSVVLIDKRGVHTRSAAALRVAMAIGFPYLLLAIFLVVPRFVRDGIYSWVARNRYRWFGKRDTCMVPTEELTSRFLDGGEPPVHPLPDDAQVFAAGPPPSRG
jgi:predicted DCC family thiol-disulfide oxidoreductase YuxK